MGNRAPRYRLGLFTWIFISFFVGSLVSLALVGLVALRGADKAVMDVAQREMQTAVDLASDRSAAFTSQQAFERGIARYRRGLVLYESGPLTFTLADFSGRITYTTPASLDRQRISAQSLKAFRSAERGTAVLYLPLRRGEYILAWQKTPSGYLSALAPQDPLLQAMFRNLLADLLYALPLAVAVAILTSVVLGFILSRSTRRLSAVRDEASAAAHYQTTHIREHAEIARRWGDVLRVERASAEGLARAFAWRDRLMSWLAAATAQPDQDLSSLAQRIVDQLPFPVAMLAIADPQRNLSFPLAMRGYGAMTARELTLPLDPPAGLVSHAYQEVRTIRLPQDREFARLGMPEELGTSAAVAVPLLADGAVRGVLTAAVYASEDLPPEAVRSLEQIAPLLGTLIARQDAVDRLRRQERLFLWVQQMNPVLMMGRATSESWWPPIAKALEEIVGVRAALLLSRQADAWHVAGSFGPGLPLLFAGSPISEWIGKLEQDPERYTGWREEGALCTGGVGDGRVPDLVLLVLAAQDPERRVLLHTLFDYLSLAYQTSVQRQAANQLARTDPLTGVLNRRALEELFEERLEEHLRRGGPEFLFVLLDLDNFKDLNDRNGHAAGDLALKEFGRHLRSRLRAEDAVGRIGGDEFVLLLDASGVPQGRLQDLFAAPPGAGGLEASFGSATVPGEAHSFAEAYRLADRRMYAMKRDRRPSGGQSTGA